MTPKWITGLVRARQFAEDNAKAELSTAERLAARAHARVRYNADRLESLEYAGAEHNASTFVASAVALQAAAATHAAAREAAAQADIDAAERRGDLTEAAVSRRTAEELAERAAAAQRALLAARAQRATDEVAAAVFRRNTAESAAGSVTEARGSAETPTAASTVDDSTHDDGADGVRS